MKTLTIKLPTVLHEPPTMNSRKTYLKHTNIQNYGTDLAHFPTSFFFKYSQLYYFFSLNNGHNKHGLLEALYPLTADTS